MIKKLTILICCIVGILQTSARSFEVRVDYLNGSSIEALLTNVSKDLIPSYYSTIKKGKERISLDSISRVVIDSEGVEKEFVPFRITVFEDELTVLALKISDNLYETHVRFRKCTCKDGYSSTKSLIYSEGNQTIVLLKRILGKKLIRNQKAYIDVPAHLTDQFSKLNYQYSLIKELLSTNKK